MHTCVYMYIVHIYTSVLASIKFTYSDSGISFLSAVSLRVFTRQSTMALSFTIISKPKTSLITEHVNITAI